MGLFDSIGDAFRRLTQGNAERDVPGVGRMMRSGDSWVTVVERPGDHHVMIQVYDDGAAPPPAQATLAGAIRERLDDLERSGLAALKLPAERQWRLAIVGIWPDDDTCSTLAGPDGTPSVVFMGFEPGDADASGGDDDDDVDAVVAGTLSRPEFYLGGDDCTCPRCAK